MKSFNIFETWILKNERLDAAGAIFEEIMAVNFANRVKNVKSQI